MGAAVWSSVNSSVFIMKVSGSLLVIASAVLLTIQADPINDRDSEEKILHDDAGIMMLPTIYTAKVKCEKLGKCIPKKNQKKCKGEIDKSGTCKDKNQVCCAPNKPKTTNGPKTTYGPTSTNSPLPTNGSLTTNGPLPTNGPLTTNGTLTT